MDQFDYLIVQVGNTGVNCRVVVGFKVLFREAKQSRVIGKVGCRNLGESYPCGQVVVVTSRSGRSFCLDEHFRSLWSVHAEGKECVGVSLCKQKEVHLPNRSICEDNVRLTKLLQLLLPPTPLLFKKWPCGQMFVIIALIYSVFTNQT